MENSPIPALVAGAAVLTLIVWASRTQDERNASEANVDEANRRAAHAEKRAAAAEQRADQAETTMGEWEQRALNAEEKLRERTRNDEKLFRGKQKGFPKS